MWRCSRQWITLGILVGLLVVPASAFAFDLHIFNRSLTEFRQDFRGRDETPTENYLGFGFNAPEAKLKFESNLQYSYDIQRRTEDFNLYEAVLHVDKLWDVLSIDAGRQFLNPGFDTIMADGLKLNITPPGYIDIMLYGGVPRTVEIGDFNRDDGLYSGLNLNLKNIAHTEASIGVAWIKRDINTMDYHQNDTLLARASAAHGFSIDNFNPYIYGLLEYDMSGKVINTGTAGAILYPHRRVTIDVEGSYLNEDRTLGRGTIFSLYAADGLYQGRAGVTVTIIDELSFRSGYAYQQYHPLGGLATRAHVADVGFTSEIADIGLSTRATYTLRRSFGGQAHSALASIREDFTDEFFAWTGVDYTKYTKVTNDNNWGVSSITEVGYEVMKDFLILGRFEYNRNDQFNRDTRGMIRFDYLFDTHVSEKS